MMGHVNEIKEQKDDNFKAILSDGKHKYGIRRTLGAGGTCKVYLGIDLETR